jgi:hypothetical protein
MQDDKEEVFELFTHWLYFGLFALTNSLVLEPVNTKFSRLIDLFILGDNIIAPGLQNDVIREFYFSIIDSFRKIYFPREVVYQLYDVASVECLWRMTVAYFTYWVESSVIVKRLSLSR